PLYFFTKEIGGDLVSAINLTPAGVEPHDYEPTTSDIATIEKSALLVINGDGLEPWEGTIQQNLKDSETDIVVVSDALAKDNLGEDGKTNGDPHMWLDPVLAKEEVSEITKGLNKISAGNTLTFGNNA